LDLTGSAAVKHAQDDFLLCFAAHLMGINLCSALSIMQERCLYQLKITGNLTGKLSLNSLQ
jgi:hypothetical protein